MAARTRYNRSRRAKSPARTGPAEKNESAPDPFESRDALVEQSSPENCSQPPYVLSPVAATAGRNANCVT